MEKTTKIDTETITLTELFSKKLKIPEYQRPYIWTEKEINKLLFQIKQHNERQTDKPMFYLGSIVLHQDKDFFNIIDGQQRLTTLQILSYLKNKSEYISYNHPISLKNIKSNYFFFKDKLQEFDWLNFDIINVTTVITQSEDMAYNFFETLNTGGKRLSGTDILKAHHLRSISKSVERNKYALSWEEMQKNLEKVNQILVKARRIDYLKAKKFPDKFANDTDWKNVLTEDFADNVNKSNRDVGYSLVEIEENTHTIISDKYSIRQPLNEGKNYINYLLSYANDYNDIFETKNQNDFYARFNNELIERIDGTIDLRSFYQICLLCFVDKFGQNNLLEFSLWLFRHIYSLRISEQGRIYETTVLNYINETKIIERIFNAFNYWEILEYLKQHSIKIKIKDIGGVRERFFNRICDFFSIDDVNDEIEFDQKLKYIIEKLITTSKDEI